jgi:hypothetical protein
MKRRGHVLRKRYGRAGLPHGWQDWARLEQRPVSPHDTTRFIAWAEPAPSDPSGSRYAVVDYQNSIRWARVPPNPDVSIDYSSGAFYADMPGGAVAAAKRAAMLHKAHIRKLVSR